MPTKRVHVIYSGRVQGVGFRFIAEAVARKLKVNGWASNLKDGTVEVVVEGDEQVLKDFLNRIAGEMARYITDTEISWEQSTGEFKSFGIKFLE